MLQCLFRASFFWGGVPPKTYNFPPPKRLLNCMLYIFYFSRGNELQIYHGNIRLMKNKHRKLFVIK